jgi:hypothetical protein
MVKINPAMVKINPAKDAQHPLPTLLGSNRQQQTSAKPNAQQRAASKGSRCAAPLQKLPKTPQMSVAEKDFMAAVMTGNIESVRELLCKHGPPLLMGHGGGITTTAILYAAQAGNQDICDAIVDHGGVQVLSRGRDVNNLGAAEHAEKEGHLELALHLRSFEQKPKELANMHRRPAVGNHKLS